MNIIRSMFRAKTQPQAQGFARERANVSRWREYCRGETVVRSLGLALAVGAATFASYMISNNDREPEFAGLEHLAIFSRPTTSIIRRMPAEKQTAAGGQSEMDYTPVGSISSAKRNLPVRGFVLLQATSDAAVIQGPNGVARVSQGDILRGLGRITAIERRGEKWVVVTPSGLIVSN
ncbi:MAG: hypothetical protein HYS06_02835 [Methylocystis sp.]|nr:hypothetical protein [Methylocystis sp.]